MSKKKSYFPPTEAEQIIWYANFKLKFLLYIVELAITLAERNMVIDGADAHAELINYANALQTYSKAFTAWKRKLILGKTSVTPGPEPTPPTPPVLPVGQLTGILHSVFAFITNLKTRNGYTEEIGKNLGIIGTDPEPIDWDVFVSNLLAESLYNANQLSFAKGDLDGINVYSRVVGSPTWVFLCYISHSPYLDNRPLVAPLKIENREYYSMGVLHDHEVGHPSPTVSAVFEGPKA